MPCFVQKRSLDFRSRRDTTNDRDPMAPKPVRPRAIRYHGLFGMAIAAQHLIVDERWSPSSLTDIYASISELLKCRVTYKKHETKMHRARLLVESKSMKIQCANGRLKLQKITVGDNAHLIHNLLHKYKDMQRLYQRMPIHLIVENINQRTFAMRKERDRLECRLKQLKLKYKTLLLDRSKLHNLIKYYEAFIPIEELQVRVLQKKIENSKVRLNAIRIINTTYKKMEQVLLQDEIFYEPILRSLDEDIEDQNSFIKHILYLGMPAIAKFKVLSKEMLRLEAKARADLKSKVDILNSLKKPLHLGPPEVKIREIATADPKRYLRLTDSMAILKKELQSIESTIKNLKLTVLCSQAKEIYPRIKTQVENNDNLHREIVHQMQTNEMLQTKMKCSTMLSDVLINNLSDEEIKRLNKIDELRSSLKTENEFEQEVKDHMRNRADAFVMMRFSLWNLFNMLININPPNPRVTRTYRSSALRLPLLKFELLDVRTVPPDQFPEDIDVVMHYVKRRLYTLKKAFHADMMSSILHSREKYHQEFLKYCPSRTSVFQDDKGNKGGADADMLMDKSLATIPNRKQIKAQSARLVEEASKRDEQ